MPLTHGYVTWQLVRAVGDQPNGDADDQPRCGMPELASATAGVILGILGWAWLLRRLIRG